MELIENDAVRPTNQRTTLWRCAEILAGSATLRETSLFHKGRGSNCSLNMASEKCSEYGEIKKFGSNLECVCKTGFSGDGVNCVDIDECKTGTARCSVHADCINTLGSYYCKCHEDFEEDPRCLYPS